MWTSLRTLDGVVVVASIAIQKRKSDTFNSEYVIIGRSVARLLIIIVVTFLVWTFGKSNNTFVVCCLCSLVLLYVLLSLLSLVCVGSARRHYQPTCSMRLARVYLRIEAICDSSLVQHIDRWWEFFADTQREQKRRHPNEPGICHTAQLKSFAQVISDSQ